MSFIRKRIRIAALAAYLGAATCAVQGCDPTMQDSLLSSIGSAASTLSTTLINAIITSMQAHGHRHEGTTVRANETDIGVLAMTA